MKQMKLLNHDNQDDATLTFKEKQGIELLFEITGIDLEEAAKLAKAAVKSQQ